MVTGAHRARRARAGRGPGPRPAFTLAEVLLALVLLGCTALAAASAEAWAARTIAVAEAREAGAAAAELVLDSLLAQPDVGAGTRVVGGIALDWVAVPRGAGTELRLRVRPGAGAGEAWYGALAAPPPEGLGSAPSSRAPDRPPGAAP